MKITFKQMYGGLHWVYETEDNKHSLSIICHTGSYGWEHGKFETRCSWLQDVQGHLSFQQVAQKIKTIYRLEAQSK